MAARLTIRLTPRASRDELMGFEAGTEGGEMLRVRVTAPPVDGRANDALLRLLARELHVPPGALELVSGHTARTKVIEVEGLTSEEVRERLSR